MALDPFDCIRSGLIPNNSNELLATPNLDGDFIAWWWQLPQKSASATVAREQLYARLGLSKVSITGKESPHDPRVNRVLSKILTLENFDDAMDILKQSANLSYSRLRALVKQQAGINLKTNLSGYQIKRFVEAVAATHSLTEAAHQVGFHDSAHFTRAIRRAFNLSPSMMIGDLSTSAIFQTKGGGVASTSAC